ncbi:MAG: HAD-IA family hydrolase [Chloroflexi bacterium]|nr:HAD-IA family hydrolase [Chloroflexota bacterium]
MVFDCDGVLVDSERLSIRLDAILLERLGWPMAESEIVERFVGRTEGAMRAEIEAHVGRDVGAEWEAFSDEYIRLFAAELEPVDGVVGVLDAVAASGMAMCVASSGDHPKIRRNLVKTGLLDWFEGRIFSGDDVVDGKPAPDLFLHAAAAMGAEPARCAVVEDSRHGVAAARAAGMRAFGYAGGVTPAAALEGPRTTVFRDMAALPGLLGIEADSRR